MTIAAILAIRGMPQPMSPLATYLVETFLTLLAVVGIAILVLVVAKRLGVGRPHGPMRLLGRMPLDARRVVYLVRVADRVLILGASEAGLTRLGQLSRRDVEDIEAQPPAPAFAELLARVRGNKTKTDRTEPPADEPKGAPPDA